MSLSYCYDKAAISLNNPLKITYKLPEHIIDKVGEIKVRWKQMTQVRDILIAIPMVILLLLAWIYIPVWFIRRSIPKVIRIFRKNNAIGIQNAKTVEALGLRERSFIERMWRGVWRDWKPKALDFLIQAKVVLMTEDGKFYITEESLTSALWLKIKQ